MRRVLRSTLIVALFVLPTESLAAGKVVWHTKHYEQTDDMLTDYWAAQAENIPVYTVSEQGLATKTHLTMMFLCSPSTENRIGLEINLAFDERPKFTSDVKRDAATGVSFYPVILALYKNFRDKEPSKYIETLAHTSLSLPPVGRNLGLDPKHVDTILDHHKLAILFMMHWAGGPPVKANMRIIDATPSLWKVKELCGMD